MSWCILECFGIDEDDHTDVSKALKSNIISEIKIIIYKDIKRKVFEAQ